MNKIYKLVWSKVRNAWVVASEIAKGHGKNASATRERKLLKTAVITAIMGGCLMTGGLASAALTEDQKAVYDAVMAELNQKVDDNKIHYLAIGPDNEKNLSKEGNYNNDGVEQHWGIAIGVNASSKDGDGIALGVDSRARGNSSTGLGSLSSAVGDYSTATGHDSQAFGDSASAFGALARAYGANGVAIGGGALVANSKALTKAEYDALSEEEKALYHTEKTRQDEFYQYKQKTGSGAIKDIEVNGVAVGNFAKSIGYGGVSVGNFAKSMGKGGVAIGDHAKASDQDNVNNSTWGVALGAYSQNKVSQGVAIGTLSVADREKGAMGYLPTTGTVAADLEEAMQAAGKAEVFKQFKTDYEAANAKLNEAKAAYEADPTNDTLKAAFEDAKKKADDLTDQYAVMTAPWKSQKGAVSVGNDKTGFTRQITGVAAGSEDTDAVNVAQLKAVNTKVDQNKTDITEINKKITNLGESSGWTLAVARGDDSKTEHEATAEGESTKVSGGTVTLKAGRGVKLKQDGTNVQIGLKFIDMDPAGSPFNDAKAIGGGSLAVGQNSVADGHQATAVGFDTKAGEYGVALGAASEAGKSAVAIGNTALANGEGSIAIGTPKQKVEGYPNKGFRKVDSEDAIAIGTETAVDNKSEQSTALGVRAEVVKSVASAALGSFAKVQNSDYSTAVGNGALVRNSRFGTALGNFAAVSGTEGGVALGSHSLATRKSGGVGYNLTNTPWRDLNDYLIMTGQIEAYTKADAALTAAQKELAADPDNYDLQAKVAKAAAERNAIYNSWISTNGAVSIGNEATGITRQLTGVAAGTQDTDAVNVAQLKALNTKVDNGAIHYVSVTPINKAQTADSNYFNDGAKGDGGIAIGESALSQGRGIAMGHKAKADPKVDPTGNINAFDGIAIGHEADAEKTGSIALGVGATAKRSQKSIDEGYHELGGISIGTAALTEGDAAIALGANTKSYGRDSMSLGNEATSQASGVAVGAKSKAAEGGIAVGRQAHANDFIATSVGTSSDAGKQATAIGAATTADGTASTAVGIGAVSKGVLSTALGATSVAEEANSIALGAGAVANTKAGEIGYIATGGSATFEEALVTLNKKEDYDKWTATVNESKAEYDNFTKAFEDASEDKKAEAKQALDDWKKEHKDFVNALEAKSKLEATWKATEAAVSVGADGVDKAGNRIIKSRQITNVAAGTKDTDAVNVAQLKAVNTKVDKNTTDITELTTKIKNAGGVHYFSVNGDDSANPKGTNFNNDGAKGGSAIAAGRYAGAQGDYGTAVGSFAQAGGEQSSAFGVAANASGVAATAAGNNAKAMGTASTATGSAAIANGTIASAFGSAANATRTAATAVGSNTIANGEIASAFGSAARAIGRAATAVGSNAVANEKTASAFGSAAKATGVGATALGFWAQAKSNESVAVGAYTVAEKHAAAIGPQAKALSEQAVAVGGKAEAQAAFSLAVGAQASATQKGGVALGGGSLADRQAGVWGFDASAGKAMNEDTLLGEKKAERAQEIDKLNGLRGELKQLRTELEESVKKDPIGQDGKRIPSDKTKQIQENLKNKTDEFDAQFKLVNGYVNAWQSIDGAVSVGNADLGITRQITGVAAGTQDTDAVNVAQLRNVATTPLNFYFGGSKDKNNTYTPGTTNWSMSLNDFRMDFGDGLKAEQVTDKDGKKYTLVTLDKDSLKNDPNFKGPQGEKGETGAKGDKGDTGLQGPQGEKGETGAKGADGKDGKSAYDTWKEQKGNEGKTEKEFLEGLKGKDGVDGKDGAKGADGKDGKSAYEIWKEKPGNEGKSEDDFLKSLKGKDGKDGTGTGGASVEAGKNISVDKKDPTKSVVSLKDEITVKSVTAGGVTIKDNKITGLAPGEISKDSKDAVNGSQLFATNQMVVNNMNQINNLRDESREGDAMGAAMAALKPLDFDPYQRSQVMAGIGHYKGKEAVALGLAHYNNEDLMIHGGLAFAGNSDVMANVGVTYRFGRSDEKRDRDLRMPQYEKGPITSVYILQDEVQSLKRENDAIRKENKEAKDRIAALEAKLEKVLEKGK